MKKYPSKLAVDTVQKSADAMKIYINGRWVPARPMGYQSFNSRVKLAWMVFRGKADALVWPENQ